MKTPVVIALDLCCSVAGLASIYLIKDDPCLQGSGLAMVGLDAMFLLVLVCIPCLLFSWRRGRSYINRRHMRADVSFVEALPVLTLFLFHCFLVVALPVIFLHPLFPVRWLCESSALGWAFRN
jgi:hypothetical protein